MIPGHNIWNIGNEECWDHDFDPQTANGRIWGSESTDEGRFEACTTNPTNTKWVSSPAVMKASIDAAYSDSLAPFFMGWTHIRSGSDHPTLDDLEVRPDFVASLDNWINQAAARTIWKGWRPAK